MKYMKVLLSRDALMPARQRTRLASVEQAFGQQLDPCFEALVAACLDCGGGVAGLPGCEPQEAVDALFGFGTIMLCVLLLCELMVRARDRIRQHPLPLQWHCLDLFRLGLIYGVALEAFKVGS